MKTKYDEFIKEIEFNLIETEYITNYKELRDIEVEEKQFTSKNNNLYSVYFMITEEDDEKLSNGKYLSEYTELDKIPTIFFSISERGFGENFDKLTNKKEYLEVMGKVVYIIFNYINKHNYTTYSVGELGDKKINFYNNYRKHFKEFTVLTGPSSFYTDSNDEKGTAYFLVKEKIQNENIKKIKLDENCFLHLKNMK